jgi:hypothetical protein
MAGFYLFQKSQLNSRAKEDLNKGYAELERLYGMKPHPGNDKVDNIKEARKQQQELRDVLGRVRKHFERVPAIPDSAKVTGEDFTALLRRTLDQLHREAGQSSVALPPRYDFTFQAIKPKVTFAPGSLQLLAARLGEVKAICDVLFRAKVNALESLRRERVSSDDNPQEAAGDYLEQQSVTNDLAVLTPYEISFRCFSSELGAVLDGFRGSPHGFIVKTVNIEPAPALVTTEQAGAVAYAPLVTPVPTPATPPPGVAESLMASEVLAQRYRDRYGMGPATPPAAAVAVAPAPTGIPASGVAPRGGLQTILNEKLLRVSLLVNVVKPLPRPQR